MFNIRRLIPHKHDMEYKGKIYYRDGNQVISRRAFKCKKCNKQKIH